ncbi:MAG: MBL fold metallo-hydrolase [Bacteroidia bacterium]|nr:MBL fold metallo-hydrolase [Bacteroidia bacterium]
MKPAFQKDEKLLADIHSGRHLSTGFRLWWLGQSGFLIQWQGKHLLIDPYLSDSLTKKYAQTDKPHVRLTERVIDPLRLDFMDVITSSHNHTDHLDGETLIPLLKVNPSAKLVIPEANRPFVVNRLLTDFDFPIGIVAGQSVDIAGFQLTAIPSAHEELETDAEGRNIYLGYVISFGEWTIYHSGDTVMYAGLEEYLNTYSPDILLLPINGRSPERKVAGNLNAAEAAFLGKSVSARWVIPCHYDMFEFNTADPQDFVKEAGKIGLPFKILKNGERADF